MQDSLSEPEDTNIHVGNNRKPHIQEPIHNFNLKKTTSNEPNKIQLPQHPNSPISCVLTKNSQKENARNVIWIR